MTYPHDNQAEEPVSEEEGGLQTLEGVDDINEQLEILPMTYTISSYGVDYPVDGLVKRLEQGDIQIPTFDPEFHGDEEIAGFQRDFMWTKPQSDRFIESLLLGFPVPGIFLVKQTTGVLLVLDGHQRLRTLEAFYGGVLRGREYRLSSTTIQEPYGGLRYRDLDPEDRRRLDDSIIHATVLRQEDPPNDHSSVYQIFERLNTGGTNLQAQEIRVALYRGPILVLLRDLNNDPAWRDLYGQRPKRLKDHELVLRFLALYERHSEYKRPLKGFLNDYMAENTDISPDHAARLTAVFTSTTSAINEGIGRKAFRPQTNINAAAVDSVMFGVAKRIDRGVISDPEALLPAYEQLLTDDRYLASIQSSTADEESVKTRLELASEAFSGIA